MKATAFHADSSGRGLATTVSSVANLLAHAGRNVVVLGFGLDPAGLADAYRELGAREDASTGGTDLLRAVARASRGSIPGDRMDDFCWLAHRLGDPLEPGGSIRILASAGLGRSPDSESDLVAFTDLRRTQTIRSAWADLRTFVQLAEPAPDHLLVLASAEAGPWGLLACSLLTDMTVLCAGGDRASAGWTLQQVGEIDALRAAADMSGDPIPIVPLAQVPLPFRSDRMDELEAELAEFESRLLAGLAGRVRPSVEVGTDPRYLDGWDRVVPLDPTVGGWVSPATRSLVDLVMEVDAEAGEAVASMVEQLPDSVGALAFIHELNGLVIGADGARGFVPPPMAPVAWRDLVEDRLAAVVAEVATWPAGPRGGQTSSPVSIFGVDVHPSDELAEELVAALRSAGMDYAARATSVQRPARFADPGLEGALSAAAASVLASHAIDQPDDPEIHVPDCPRVDCSCESIYRRVLAAIPAEDRHYDAMVELAARRMARGTIEDGNDSYMRKLVSWLRADARRLERRAGDVPLDEIEAGLNPTTDSPDFGGVTASAWAAEAQAIFDAIPASIRDDRTARDWTLLWPEEEMVAWLQSFPQGIEALAAVRSAVDLPRWVDQEDRRAAVAAAYALVLRTVEHQGEDNADRRRALLERCLEPVVGGDRADGNHRHRVTRLAAILQVLLDRRHPIEEA